MIDIKKLSLDRKLQITLRRKMGASMAKEHLVIVKKEDGTVASYRMKEWLRHNPEFVPEGLDPSTNTSHELRRGLTREGWLLHEKVDKVILLKPHVEGLAISEGMTDDIFIAGESIGTEIVEAKEISFGLESDLQRALRANISQLEAGLTIIDGGKEKITEVGRFDITAKDERGTPVVIELKAGMANPDVIAQILSYMGLMAQKEGTTTVRGILIAGDFHKRVILAAKAISNLCLIKYSIQFSFNNVTASFHNTYNKGGK